MEQLKQALLNTYEWKGAKQKIKRGNNSKDNQTC